MSNNSQIIYVLTNPAMLRLIKIGKTTQLEVESRMKQLFSTGVPVPFDCEFACQVKNATEVEKALHDAFTPHRINPNREFFKLDAERVIAILKLLKVQDITAQFEQDIEKDTTASDKQSAQAMKDARRQRMDFHALGIPDGSFLDFKDGSMQVKVMNNRQVLFMDVICSLSSATRSLLGLPSDYALQPSPYWRFKGKSLKEIYDDYHDGLDLL